MTAAMLISLVLTALGFWAWTLSSLFVFSVRVFNKEAFVTFSYMRVFMMFFVPLIMLILSAIAAKAG